MAALVIMEVGDPHYCPAIRFAPGGLKTPVRLTAPLTLDRYDAPMIPAEAYLESSHKRVADFVPIDGRLSMCPEARNLIEALEPGVHQFFPVNIVRKRGTKPIYRLDGRELETPYYYFHVQTMLDAVWVERSKVRTTNDSSAWVEALMNKYPGQFTRRAHHASAEASRVVSFYPGHYDKVVLRRTLVDGHHVWRGKYQMANHLFFSDSLVEKIMVLKLKKLNFTTLIEM